jgi:hypothetical protein
MGCWKIRSGVEKDQETGKSLYWSNEDGWVSSRTATVFSDREMRSFSHIPGPARWVKSACSSRKRSRR